MFCFYYFNDAFDTQFGGEFQNDKQNIFFTKYKS